jgi:hypothetical protein
MRGIQSINAIYPRHDGYFSPEKVFEEGRIVAYGAGEELLSVIAVDSFIANEGRVTVTCPCFKAIICQIPEGRKGIRSAVDAAMHVSPLLGFSIFTRHRFRL